MGSRALKNKGPSFDLFGMLWCMVRWEASVEEPYPQIYPKKGVYFVTKSRESMRGDRVCRHGDSQSSFWIIKNDHFGDYGQYQTPIYVYAPCMCTHVILLTAMTHQNYPMCKYSLFCGFHNVTLGCVNACLCYTSGPYAQNVSKI